MAASMKPRPASLAILLLYIVGAQILGDHRVSAQCGGSLSALVAQCSEYVGVSGHKVPPSAGCCQEVTKFDVPCVCKFVTPEVEGLLSMDKAVYVARTCGLAVQPGMKCGIYTVPPLALV